MYSYICHMALISSFSIGTSEVLDNEDYLENREVRKIYHTFPVESLKVTSGEKMATVGVTSPIWIT